VTVINMLTDSACLEGNTVKIVWNQEIVSNMLTLAVHPWSLEWLLSLFWIHIVTQSHCRRQFDRSLTFSVAANGSPTRINLHRQICHENL